MKLLILMISSLSLSAFAVPRVGNGGDDVGVEFQSSFETSLTVMKEQLPLAYKQISNIDFDSLIKDAKVLVVDDTLNVSYKGIVQNSVAVNQSDAQEIFVNRDRWNKIYNPAIKQAIALHEYLGLKGIEQTGVYTISAQFLSLFGSSMDDALIMNPANPIQAAINNSPTVDQFRIIQYFYEKADSKFDFDDVPAVSEALLQKPVSCHISNNIGFPYSNFSGYFVKKEVLLPSSSEKIYNVAMIFEQADLQALSKKSIQTVTGFRYDSATLSGNEILQVVHDHGILRTTTYRKLDNLIIYQTLAPVEHPTAGPPFTDVFYGYCEMIPSSPN